MVATALNARWVSRAGPQRMLSYGTAVAALAGSALALLGWAGNAGLTPIVICVVLYISVTGLLGANCLACLLACFPQQAGAAAGLAVAMQFGLGMACSALVGFFHDGTPLPMSLIIGATGLGSLCAYRMARVYGRRPGQQTI